MGDEAIQKENAASQRRKREDGRPDAPNKLARIPLTHKIDKRPLIHPPIPSPYASASSQKVVYVSPRTPFMSAVQRVRQLLKQVEKRESQSVNAQVVNESNKARRNPNGGRKLGASGGGDKILAAAVTAAERREELVARGTGEEVIIKGTGKAIEKVLGLAEFFRGKERVDGLKVVLRTGTVTAIDDVIPRTEEEYEIAMERKERRDAKNRRGQKPAEDSEDTKMADASRERADEAVDDAEEVPEARLRQTSVLEVGISLR